MKRIFLLLILCAVAFTAVIGSRSSRSSSAPRAESKQARQQARAARQEAFERATDSTILSRNYRFIPSTMQRLYGGSMQNLVNPNFELAFWDNGTVEVYLPYIVGITPPYRHTIINYTLPSVNGYTAIQGDGTWRVSFNSSLITASDYDFTLDINARYGTAMLTVDNSMQNNVQYSGTVSKYY